MSEEDFVTDEQTLKTEMTDSQEPAAVKEQRDRTNPDSLPKDTVHCYPANLSVIRTRRIISAILAAISILGLVYMMLPASQNLIVAALCAVVLVVSGIVFAHTFLIASYRVAVDYTQKEIVLRYQFQKIKISFENFETRDGKPDKADELRNLTSPKHTAVLYLILDDVRASACYQTSSADLCGFEDFGRLRKDAIEIQSAYRGTVHTETTGDTEDEMDNIIKNARS